MMKRRLYIFALIASLFLASACHKEVQPEPGTVLQEGETVLLLSTGMSGLELSADTKASSGNWIQERIGMTNVAIIIFDHDSGKKVYSGAKYPFKLVDPAEPYQLAWLLGNFTPEDGHTYDLAFACNFPKAAELNAFIMSTDTWDELTAGEPVNPTFRMPRTDMSNPTTVANAAGENENQPMVAGYSAYLPKDGGKMYVNQWRSPILSGYIRDITLEKGKLNLVGFGKDGSDNLILPPESDYLARLNEDLGTNYSSLTDLPQLVDATPDKSGSARTLAISPCYALLVVDELATAGEASTKLEITDIFMMNVPMYHNLFADETYHFGSSPENFKNTIGIVAYSSGKDLVSGFKPSWIDNTFKEKTKNDDFARLLHYPADGTVPQSAFISQYKSGEGNTATTQGDNNGNSRYFFKIAQTGQLLDRLCISNSPVGSYNDGNSDWLGAGGVPSSDRLKDNWAWLKTNFPLAYTTATTRKAPFFLLSENLGDYPNELTVDDLGKRQYLFATRLVIRGKWKETPTSPEEIVYYPILVNGPAQGFKIESESVNGSAGVPDAERFVHKGRRYIYSIKIQSKGVSNPWAAASVPVSLGSLELHVDKWISYQEIPVYIF